jgi:hypothetical protein
VVVFMPIAYARYQFGAMSAKNFMIPKYKCAGVGFDCCNHDSDACMWWHRFAIMGGLDVVGTIGMMFGGAHTAGSLQILLRQVRYLVLGGLCKYEHKTHDMTQFPLLFTIVITYIFLRIRCVFVFG